MATVALGEEFVTIVPVGEGRPAAPDSAFVTVLTVGAAAGAAEVLVHRPRGARLGLGLKFEGGSAAAEKVRRLLVQSCAENSPAASASTPWGHLIPGDEILAIDNVAVSDLTRIDCVRRLKDSDETLKLLVRHFETNNDNNLIDTTMVEQVKNQSTEITRPNCLPPPVPPRKLGKKNSFKERPTFQKVGEQTEDILKQVLGNKDLAIHGSSNALTTIKLSRKSSFDSHIHRQNKEGIAYLKKGSPEEVRRLVRRLSDGKAMPPEAEVYIDLLSTEWERCLALADAESDDTGSSISTVVDRLGSMTNSVENSIPSTPVLQPKTIDIQKVLNCIENIDSDILKDMAIPKIQEMKSEIRNEMKSIESISEKTPDHYIVSETLSRPKETTMNDKNNNNTIVRNITRINVDVKELTSDSGKVSTVESVPLKPKPMPRINKSDWTAELKKPKEFSPTDNTKNVPETLLTPTKKNCIETWLQHSEAEMNQNGSEATEEIVVPEALPRLIDFVPKTPFKDCSTEIKPARPTTQPPPPPPPAEVREDGSGASLDTIGELDETGDVVDNGKSMTPPGDGVGHKSFNPSFWEDRVLKSDAEDKSLSNDETPPPTCPRQPPDGVEAPSDIIEKAVESISTRTTSKFPGGWPTNRSRLSYSRSQDPRSEASVKDKIAMFSNDRGSSSDLLEKCGTMPSRITAVSMCRKTSTPCVADICCPEIRTLDRRLTKSQDNLDDVVMNEQRPYKKLSERPEVVGALESKKIISSTSTITPNRIKMTENKFAFYGSTTTLNSTGDSSSFKNVYHRRSSSDDFEKNSHKSNLEYLIEQRKKSMSKLRGLMIPDIQAPIVDLPEIKVQGNLCSNFLLHSSDKISALNNKTQKQISKPMKINETWRTNLLPNNLPKYSPAFKRKSLQVYSPSSLSKESTPERKMNQTKDINSISKTLSSKPRLSLDLTSAPEKLNSSATQAKLSLTRVMKLSENDYKNKVLNSRDFSNVEIKICTATEVLDSDNDSAVSSTQSSYRSSASSPLHNLDSIESDSSHLSPRNCHYASYATIKSEISAKAPIISKNCDEYGKQKVRRSMSSDTNVSLSSSAGSAATSGSQASCSSLESSVPDLEKRKVSKTYNTNIDTLNRRNIVASAKCRSGRDNKLNSPVIETKFLHEPCETPSSPNKTSDRLSTLTPSVSAISNKGENRRRSKMVTDTDSDSDTEQSVRQRKSEFKNTRLKRNSSLHKNDKNKQNEVVGATTAPTQVTDEPPQVISERIIKEIKKAGLDDYYDNQTVDTKHLLDRYDKEIRQNSYSIITKRRENCKTKGDAEHQGDDVIKKLNGKSDSDLSIDNKFDKNTKKLQIVRLKKGTGSGVGLILAGGIDCEAKEVTIHRVLVDSVAERAGLKRGLRVRSVNGTTMEGLTHSQSVAVLKEQRSEVVIEIEDASQNNATKTRSDSEQAESKVRHEVESSKDFARVPNSKGDGAKGALVTVLLEKAGGGAGLGFGLDGGRDSPRGDLPLTIKKLFAGGAAARNGRVSVGAELVSAAGQQFGGYTRTQAWAALKALPAGPVALVLKNPPDATSGC